MNAFKLILLEKLIDLGELEAAFVIKSSEVRKGRSNLQIDLPLWAYRGFNCLPELIKIIEKTIVDCFKDTDSTVSTAWAASIPILGKKNPSHQHDSTLTLEIINELVQQSKIHITQENYGQAVISARKTIELVLIEIVKEDDRVQNVYGKNVGNILETAKAQMIAKLKGKVAIHSIDVMIDYIDVAVKAAMGIPSKDKKSIFIKFNTAKIRANYITNLCYSTAHFLFETFLD